MEVLIIIVAITLAISFVSSLFESSLYAINIGRVEALRKKGKSSGLKLAQLRDNIDEPIAAILTLNTLSHTIGATLAGATAAKIFSSIGIGIFSAFFTLAILILAEIIPKTIGVIYAQTLAPLFAWPIQWTIWIFYPFVKLCQVITQNLPKASKMKDVAEEDILAITQIGAKTGMLLTEEAKLTANVLKLNDTSTFDLLTPRTVIFSLREDTSLEEIRKNTEPWTHSRIPVTKDGDLDHITGIVLRHDIFNALSHETSDKVLKDFLKPVYFVPHTLKGHKLLEKFLKEKQHIFIVIDEYGGTMGLVTLEDVMEFLLGEEIIDEYDRYPDMQAHAKYKAKKEKPS